MLKNISFHQSCKCGCLLDEKVCNKKQKWNSEKCRCECLMKEKCDNNSFFNVVNCSCEMEEVGKAVVESKRFPEKCKEVSNDVKENDCIVQNKTLIKKVENCKPFVTSSILFVCITVMTTGITIYFCLKSKNSSALDF